MKKNMLRAVVFVWSCLILANTIKAVDAAYKTAPDFTLKNTNEKDFTFSKETRDKVVFVNFWATWCGPCRAEIPAFIKLYEKYKDQGFLLVGVALDRRQADVKKFVKNNKLSYPVLFGNPEVAQTYGDISGIPKTFIVDRKGMIIKEHSGYMSEQTAELEIKQLLSSPASGSVIPKARKTLKLKKETHIIDSF